MWALGWPHLDKVKNELRSFYNKVRETSMENKSRFKAPLEHLMTHICLICTHLQECEIGRFTLNDISKTMESFARLQQKRCCIANLKDGMKHLVVKGNIISMSEPKEAETRYGRTQLVIAQLKDETGEIPLNLYGEQVGKVNAGDIITIENAYTLLYEGKLTLNIPKDEGRLITQNKTTNHLNLKVDEVESNSYHKVVVDKLEGSYYKGKFSEISILKVFKNQHYSCPNDCLYYEGYECKYKKPLMNKPVKDKLICTTVLIEIGSSLPPDVGTLKIRGGWQGDNRILDSKGRGYRNFSTYLCENLHSQAKQKLGYISRGAFDCIDILEGTKEAILLPFPEIPEKENIVGIILELWSTTGGWNKTIEVFDFRLKPVSLRK
jgi:replication factor A1